MRTIEFAIGKKTLHLYFNGAAMFALNELNEKAGEDSPEILDLVLEHNALGFDALCKVAAVLAEQGELCRRYLGYSKERIPTEQELRCLLDPIQVLGLRSAVMQTVNDGYNGSKSEDDGDIDLGLAELEKKQDFNQGRLSQHGGFV